LIGTLLLSKLTLSKSVDSMEGLWNEGLTFVGANLRCLNNLNIESQFLIDVLSYLIQQHRIVGTHADRSGVRQYRVTIQLQSFYELIQKMQRGANEHESFVSTLFQPIFDLVKSALVPIQSKLESPYYSILLWLCAKASYECAALSDSLYKYLFDVYRSFFRAELAYLSPNAESCVIHEGWIAAGLYMHAHHLLDWISTLSIACGTLTDDLSSSYVRRQKIRIHLRWLAHMACNISNNTVLNEIADALRQCFRAFQQDDFLDESTIDAFSWVVEASVFQSAPLDLEPLLTALTDAINKLPTDEGNHTLEAFAESTADARRLAIIYNHLTNQAGRDIIQNRLLRVTLDGVSVANLIEVQSIVSELLSTREPVFVERARSLYDQYDPIGKERNLPGWKEWSYRIRLHLAYIDREIETIERVPFPEVGGRENYEATRKFYKALMLYEQGDGDNLIQAIKYLKDLHSHQSGELSFLINLVAAYVRYLSDFSESQAEDSKIMSDAKSYANELLSRVTEATTPNNILAAVNALYIFIVLQDWDEYWERYHTIPERIQRQLPVSITRLEASVRRHNWQEARALLEELQVGDESNPVFSKYRTQIEEQISSGALPVETAQVPWSWEDIANVLTRFKTEPDPNLKAQAYWHSGDITYEKLIQILVLQSCQKVKEHATYLIRQNQIASEDTYSHLLYLILQARLNILGWSVDFQTHLGMSGSIIGNGERGHGEPDVVISDNGRRLAVCEAIKLTGIRSDYTKTHILKVRGYDPTDCLLYFQIIWCGASNWATVWEDYKDLINNINEWNNGRLPLVAINSEDTLNLIPYVGNIPHFESEHTTSQGVFSVRYLHVLADVWLGEQQGTT
jgi:hypothetical protein